VPRETEKEILKKLQTIVDESLIEGAEAEVLLPGFDRTTYTGMKMEVPASNYPFKTDKKEPILINAKEILQKELGEIAEPDFWKFATDGGHFSKAGLTIVGFGPGDESLAHTVDEHIPISQLKVAIRGYSALAKHLQARL